MGSTETYLSLVNCTSRSQFFEQVQTRLKGREGFSVATLNLDHIIKLRADPAFRDAYRQQTYVVADGRPIVWLRRVMGQPVDLIPGSEIVEPLMRIANDMAVRVAFVGSTEDALERAAQTLKATYPDLKIVRMISPPFGFDPASAAAAAVLDEVAASGAGLCLVALGAPKQELLATRGLSHCPSVGFVSVGAGLDFIAGTQTRAPSWVRKIAMEWFWRMASSPKRLGRRYLNCIYILPGLFLRAFQDRKA